MAHFWVTTILLAMGLERRPAGINTRLDLKDEPRRGWSEWEFQEEVGDGHWRVSESGLDMWNEWNKQMEYMKRIQRTCRLNGTNTCNEHVNWKHRLNMWNGWTGQVEGRNKHADWKVRTCGMNGSGLDHKEILRPLRWLWWETLRDWEGSEWARGDGRWWQHRDETLRTRSNASFILDFACKEESKCASNPTPSKRKLSNPKISGVTCPGKNHPI